MKIIEMEDAHLVQVLEVERQCFPDPWSEALFREMLSSPFQYCTVALEEDRVAGYLCTSCLLDTAEIQNLAVSPDFRRQGVAEKLLGYFFDSMRHRGVKFLLLEVRASNQPAIRLYEKVGFLPVGLRKHYYSHPTEDALLYTKELEIPAGEASDG